MSLERPKKGFYEIKKIDIVTPDNKAHDIFSAMVTIEFSEDIFNSNFSYGTLTIIDTVDLIRNIPVIGEEEIVFQFKVTQNSDVFTKKFRIYRVETNHGELAQSNNYLIYFVASEVFYDRNILISKAYNSPTQEIVRNIFSKISEETKTPLDISNTFGRHHFIIPNLHPIEAINFVASMTQHPSYKSGLFFFYQNLYGYNFKSLEEHYSKKPLGIYRKSFNLEGGGLEREAQILEFKEISTYTDTLKTMGSGLYANTYACYDPLVKSYKEVKFNYNKGGFESTKHLNKFRLNTDNPKFESEQQRFVFIPSNSIRKKSSYFNRNNGDISQCNDLEDFAPLRASALEQILSKQFEMTIKGDDVPSLSETTPRPMTVGEIIELEFFTKSNDPNQKNKLHNYYSGKYLVVGCKHVFSKEKYYIDVKIMSDSNIADHERGLS